MLTGAVGTVFNIVHGSFVDGWGIRTTVFLKGCPLRCKWCCNPESQRPEPELQFIVENCTACGKCVPSCPQNALRITDGLLQVDRARCDGCGACVNSCWPGALEIWGKLRSAADIFEECARDAEFYKQSGGGVTLSGGEATLQPEFCLEMIARCHDAGLHVAVDTCGYVTTEQGLEVLRQADTLLFDIKGLNAELHRMNTGCSNEVILENLQRAEQWNKDVIIRYPVIPNHNRHEAQAIAELLKKLSCVKRVDIIPYHNYGSVKYEQIGRQYLLDEPTPAQSEQDELLRMFQSMGLNAQIGG